MKKLARTFAGILLVALIGAVVIARQHVGETEPEAQGD